MTPETQAALDDAIAAFQTVPGFLSSTLVMDAPSAEYTFLTVWSSLGQADAARRQLHTQWPGLPLLVQTLEVPPSGSPTDAEATLLLSEQKTLRDEIVKRLEFQHQLLGGVLVAAGTLLTVGIPALAPPASNADPIATAARLTGVPRILLLLYPVLVLFVAVAWHLHNITILRISSYIRTVIETRFSTHGLGWEHYHPSATGGSTARFLASLLSTSGVLCGTQIMAILIVSLPDPQPYWGELQRLVTNLPREWQLVTGVGWLFVFDLLVVLATFGIVHTGFRVPHD